jgi:hypothetical protein
VTSGFDWSNFPDSAKERAAALIPILRELGDTLRRDKDAEREVKDILDRRLGGPIDRATLKVLTDGLDGYLGIEDVALLLTWCASELTTGVPEIAQFLGSGPEAEAFGFIRRVSALFGRELKLSLDRAINLPDDWIVIDREVLYDFVTQKQRVELSIEKYNGDRATLAGDPDSILSLMSSIIVTLQTLGHSHSFDPTTRDRFIAETDTFIKGSQTADGAAEEASPAELNAPAESASPQSTPQNAPAQDARAQDA